MQGKILVYSDKGTSHHTLALVFKALQHLNLKVVPIKASEIIQGDWEDKAKLLIMPDGRDVFFHTLLQGEGNHRIRNFVKQGGSYLGICGGAYYAAKEVEFEKGNPIEVVGQRELAFFPNMAKGPAYGPDTFCYNSNKGSLAAPIKYASSTLTVSTKAFYNGGCTFVNAKNAKNTNILGVYEDLDQPAILETQVGRGKVILSGVHIEYLAHHLDQNDIYLKKIVPQLQKSEKTRQKVFDDIIKRLKITPSHPKCARQ